MKKNRIVLLSISLLIILFLSSSFLSLAQEPQDLGNSESKQERHFFLSHDSGDDDQDTKWPDFDELWEAQYQDCLDECAMYTDGFSVDCNGWINGFINYNECDKQYQAYVYRHMCERACALIYDREE